MVDFGCMLLKGRCMFGNHSFNYYGNNLKKPTEALNRIKYVDKHFTLTCISRNIQGDNALVALPLPFQKRSIQAWDGCCSVFMAILYFYMRWKNHKGLIKALLNHCSISIMIISQTLMSRPAWLYVGLEWASVTKEARLSSKTCNLATISRQMHYQ